MSSQNYYQERIDTFEKELAILKKQSLLLSWMRLTSFLAFVGFLILFFVVGRYSVVMIFSLLSLGALMVLVNLNLRLEDRITLISYKIQVNRNELLFLAHNYAERDTGSGFASINPYLANDFDLFGNGSLYQYLNRCTTRSGSIAFAKALCNQEKDSATIREKQAAIKELSSRNDFIQNFQANGMSTPENGHEAMALQSWLSEPSEKKSFVRKVAVILGVINVLWMILAAIQILTWGSVFIPLVISLWMVSRQIRPIAKAHSQLENISKTFVKYTTLFKLIEEEDFQSDYLRNLRQKLLSGESTASRSLYSLFRILALFDIRDNILLAFVLNAVFLFDIHTYYLLMQWKVRHKDEVNGWFSAMAEMEVLMSFATFAFNNRDTIAYPSISDNNFKIDVAEMGHPLLHPDVRVNNSVSIAGAPSIQIITGANMAGKSTFLRTVVVNLILAMNGSPVPAKSFDFTPCDIFSSIKIQDSLSNNESYFYAELIRLKQIIEHVQRHPRTLVILDEILRGTNTKDKQTGSLGLLEKLISLNAMVIIATHDLVIGELEQKYPVCVTNHCFEVELTDNQLFFDYKLKPGISTKLNASFLMKKMQIID
ncbi:MAG: mismatch repair protein MutS domain protein [Bacteroidetes bacterium]|nr:mismatch repair protein MutS domain protein [Bacteroidota bacterium]